MGLCSSGSPAPKIVTVLGPGGQLPRAGPTSTPGQRCHPQAPRPICAKNGTQRSRRNNRNTALKKTLQWDRTTGFEESFLDLENDLEFLNVPTTAHWNTLPPQSWQMVWRFFLKARQSLGQPLTFQPAPSSGEMRRHPWAKAGRCS
jgi:hypothetical protein